MLRRELHTLNNKLRNVRDKRDIVIRERYLLQERIETLVGSIGNELESRKRLRKEINEMNETFKQEMREMMAEQQAADELEECYFSDDEDLVVNTHKKGGLEEDELSNDEGEEEDVDETIEEIVNQAEEDLEEDPGAELFDNYPLADYDGIDEKEVGEEELESTRENLNTKVEKHNEKVQLMRKSNFRLKAKIDHLYDILQAQKEKHHDMRLELTRMLADIQWFIYYYKKQWLKKYVLFQCQIFFLANLYYFVFFKSNKNSSNCQVSIQGRILNRKYQ